MFGIISRLFPQVWDSSSVDGSQNPANTTDSLSSEPNSERNGQDDSLDARGSQTANVSSELSKVLYGKVTKIYDYSGLIDNEIYFTYDKITGGVRPKVNDEVHVWASRSSSNDGWLAERVEVQGLDWDECTDQGEDEILIGDITELNERYLIVCHDVHCPMTSLAFGYMPCKGDWVRAEVVRQRGQVSEVKVVQPLRQKSLTGTVTAVGCGHGYINDDIFFSLFSCRTNYLPRKGHTVKVTAIESNQSNCKWRAIKVEPRIPVKDTNSIFVSRTTQISQSKFTMKLLENKGGVEISEDINFPDVILGHSQDMMISIRNNGNFSVVLKSIEGLMSTGNVFEIKMIGEDVNFSRSSTSDHVGGIPFDVLITSNSLVKFKVSLKSRLLGEFSQMVVFHFGDFQIGRFFKATVRDERQQLLDAKTPYHRKKFVDKKESLNKIVEMRNSQQWVIPGERPMFKQKSINISTKLGQFEIPRTLRQNILDKTDLSSIVPCLLQPLSLRNYKERFSVLLHAEEVQMELEMREFDMKGVTLKPFGEFLSLFVPGLAEGRPSLLIGDRVILCVSDGSNNSPKYEGFIHEVMSTEVLLRFHEEFHVNYDEDSCDVMFFFNRTPLRRCHKAVDVASKFVGSQVLFPNEVIAKLPLQASNHDKGLFDDKLNERQRAAVRRILNGVARPMPYVLFGPPGTGKTVTLVETILQIFHRFSESRILVCTPSNSAADLITERLHLSGAIKGGDMVRLNAFQRQQSIPEDIENYSTNIDKLDVAAHFRILICTCTTAGQLHTLGLATGHFTHVLVDEAGQATEPECLVPISLLAGSEGQIVLSGDPHQLGAVLRSPITQTYGLNLSLLERLMARIPYLRDPGKFSNHGCYDPLVVTKLVQNYRSHEAILAISSRLFYHSEMTSCSEESLKNCLCEWDALPKKDGGFPLLFHGVKGENMREGNSPSWFNPVEAVQVIRYAQDLRKFSKHPVNLDDIGIITPYRKQVEKIRMLLDRLGMSEIKVGSVEEFQGQERLVIIISTVRSSGTMVQFDCSHNIGFLSNPKRFNVAITRAQALMIIVGNPHVMIKDYYWRALLRYCVDNNSYIGCDLPPFNNEFEKLSETNDAHVDVTALNREFRTQNGVSASNV